MVLHYRGYANPAYLESVATQPSNKMSQPNDAADKDMSSSSAQDRQWESSTQTAPD